MKTTGIIRQVDNVGRVVIPKEYRNLLGIRNAEDCFEIYMEEDKIILKKYQPTCVFCDNFASSIEYEGQCVCEECIEKMKSILENKQLTQDIESEGENE